MMDEEHAQGPAEVPTTTSGIPTIPEGNSRRLRYFGLVSAPSLAVDPDRPFVFATIQEAEDLVRAISRGETVTVREWIHGAVVEQETRFIGEDGVEMVLYQLWEPPAHSEWGYPDITVSIGPRGGIRHERA
jgi:hypothetical protein